MPILDLRQLAALRDVTHEGHEWLFDERVKRFSPSSIDELLTCPEKWRRRRLLGHKQRPAEAPVIGTAVHEALLDLNFDQKRTTGVDLQTHVLTDWFSDVGFDQVVEREQEEAGEEIVWDTSHDAAQTRGRKMVGAYNNEVSVRIQPVTIERRIEVAIAGVPVPMVGYVDLETDEVAIDLKSGKSKQSSLKGSWMIQGSVYGGATGKPVEFHTLACTEREQKVSLVTPLESAALLVRPSVEEQAEMTRTIAAAVAQANFYLATFGPDTPWPTYGRFHMFACSYCSFKSTCPAWTGEDW